MGALVVCADEKTCDVELISWCRTRLSEFKVPRHLFIIKELVKGPSGKILIREARNQLDTQMLFLAENNAQEKTIEARVLAVSASVFRIEQTELNVFSSPENTAGWDSLAHMNFVIALEKTFEISLSTHDIMHIDSIDLAIEVCRQKVQQKVQ